MPSLDASRLRRWADEMDAEERAEREQALEHRIARIESASEPLTAAEREELGALRERVAALEAATTREEEAPPPAEETPPGETPGEEPTVTATRPGRKSGMAYDWTVDDDGNIVDSDTAVVYSGPDEPDEVPLP